MNAFLEALSQAVKNIFRNSLATLVTVLVLSACLIFFGAFVALSDNIDYNLDDITDMNMIEVFLEYDSTPEDAERIGAEIAALDNVVTCEFVSKADGIASMQAEFGDYAYLLDDISEEENPLSDCFRITYADNDRATTLDYALKQIEGVRKVNSRLDLAAKIGSMERGVSILFVCFSILCAAICLFVVFNTVRLSVYARRDEIAIMRYIGAGRAYIARPFVLEGLIIGFVGTAVAYFSERLIYSALSSFVAEEMSMIKLYPFSALTPKLLIFFLAISIVTGVIGSLISIGRYAGA